jgi:hypothetical protein
MMIKKKAKPTKVTKYLNLPLNSSILWVLSSIIFLLLSTHLPLTEERKALFEKRKEGGSDQTRGKRLREEDSDQQGIKVANGLGIEGVQKDQEEESFNQGEREGEKGLR